MKKTILLISILSFSISIFAQQNLIPNPSFEDYNSLPNSKGGISAGKCKNWFAFRGSPDYFHVNALHSNASVPNNFWGSINPHSGLAYGGFINWCDHYCREYISIELIDTLEIGAEYEFACYISNANQGILSNAQGVLFHTEHPMGLYAPSSLPTSHSNWILKEPHYYNPNLLLFTGSWQEIRFRFVATEHYNFLNIGNFFARGDLREIILINNSSHSTSVTYIDDVSLVVTGRKTKVEYNILEQCVDGSVLVEFRGVNVGAASDWEWRFDDGTIYYDSVVVKRFETSGIQTYQVLTSEGGKSFSFYESIDINIVSPPKAAFTIKDDVVFDSPTEFINQSENAMTFFWDFGDGITSMDENPTHTYVEAADYNIMFVAENEIGCRDTIFLDVYARCGKRIVENVFTPNNDGRNDVFYFDSAFVCEVILIQVFNRWGNLVYQSTDPYAPWNGGDYPSGTYYYVVRFRDGEDKGFITLIR
jgi:gliding motility-associated-like protein